MQVDIDNDKDSECTVLTVEGKDQPHLLMTLSGALTTAGYMVVSAVSKEPLLSPHLAAAAER